MQRELESTASNGRNEQNFVSIFERVSVPAQEADVFFIHINIQETTDLAVLIPKMRFERRKFCIELGEKIVQVRRGAGELGRIFRVAA
jgi:hypothetical protein